MAGHEARNGRSVLKQDERRVLISYPIDTIGKIPSSLRDANRNVFH